MPSKKAFAPLAARSAASIKKALSAQMRREMASRNISISKMAKAVGTGRTSIRRILDEENTSITLDTMTRAAAVLGLEVKLSARRLSAADLGRLARQLPGTSRSGAAALKRKIIQGFYGR